MKDYYQVLGISKNASPDEIKKAFHILAHKYHPHKGGDEKKFKEINEAYQILSNKEKRAQYDQFGATENQGNFNWAWGQGMPNMEFDMEDLGDIFGDMFGEVFGFNGRKNYKKNLKRGKDIRVDIEIPLESVLKDIKKEISLRKKVVCLRCQGQGAEPGSNVNECFSCRGTGEVQELRKTFFGSFTRWRVCPECKGEGQKPEKFCNVCKGEGRIEGEENIDINIPAGADSNQIIKFIGKGEAGKKGGRPGDLYVRIFVKEHKLFKRKGDDLFVSLPISFSQASLGDEIEIPTLERDNITEKLPAGAESGDIIKISKKGIPHFSGYGRGDLYIELRINTPKKLTKEQKELLKKLREEGL